MKLDSVEIVLLTIQGSDYMQHELQRTVAALNE